MTRSRVVPIASALAVIVLLAWHARQLARYAVDWPLHDDLTQILAVQGYLVQLPTWWDKLAMLFSLSVEHRIATLRTVGWLGAMLPGGLDFARWIVVGNLLLLVAGILAVLSFPRSVRPVASVTAALLLTSVTHYGAHYWATGSLQHFGVVCYALAALCSLQAGQRWLLPLAFALLASFTAANGLMTFVAAAALLVLAGHYRRAAVWAVVALVVGGLYFIGYETPAGRVSTIELLGQPLRLAGFGLAALGGLGETFAVSATLGAAVLAAWGALLATGAWRRVPPWVVAAFLFLACTCAAIALGRAALGDSAASISRYRVYSAMAILFTLSACANAFDWARSRFWAVVVLALAGIAFAYGYMTTIEHAAMLSMQQRAARDHYAAAQRSIPDGFDPKFVDFTLERAKLLGVYDGERRAEPPRVPEAAGAGSGSGPAVWHSNHHRNADVLSAWGVLGGRHGSAEVWLQGELGAFRARVPVSAYHRGTTLQPATAFHATLALGGMPPGRYRLGYAGDASPGVAWTEQMVVVE